MFVKTDENNNIEQYPYTLNMFRTEHRNTSLPKFLNNGFLERRNVYPVKEAVKPDYNEVTQYLQKAIQPIYENGVWILNWIIENKSLEQIANDTNIKSAEVRAERDKLLAETDWVSVRAFDTNTSVDTSWAQYRQELRDVTTQDGFPWTVVWPQKP